MVWKQAWIIRNYRYIGDVSATFTFSSSIMAAGGGSSISNRDRFELGFSKRKRGERTAETWGFYRRIFCGQGARNRNGIGRFFRSCSVSRTNRVRSGILPELGDDGHVLSMVLGWLSSWAVAGWLAYLFRGWPAGRSAPFFFFCLFYFLFSFLEVSKQLQNE